MRRVLIVAVLAGLAAGGGAAAPQRQPAARTLLTTHSRITQFARDGHWLAWTTARKLCGRRLHLLSLRTGREVRIEQVNDGEGCADGPLTLAGGREAWAHIDRTRQQRGRLRDRHGRRRQPERTVVPR